MPREDGPNKHGLDTWSVSRQAIRDIGSKAKYPSHL